MPVIKCLNFWSALKWSGSWTRSLKVPSNWNSSVLFYSILKDLGCHEVVSKVNVSFLESKII